MERGSDHFVCISSFGLGLGGGEMVCARVCVRMPVDACAADGLVHAVVPAHPAIVRLIVRDFPSFFPPNAQGTC